MTISHHVPDDILFRHASGDLAHLWSLGVATHLALCPRCRSRVSDYEEVLGLAIETEDADTVVSVDVTDLIRKAEARPEKAEVSSDKQDDAAPAPIFPRPLRDSSGDLGQVRWNMLGGGVKQFLFGRDGDIAARLLYIPPSVAVPAHGHGGLEFTQVLAGGFFDGDQAFTRGDIQVVAHETPHQPVAMSEEACICLAITDAPLKFRNLLPRLLQPLFKI